MPCTHKYVERHDMMATHCRGFSHHNGCMGSMCSAKGFKHKHIAKSSQSFAEPCDVRLPRCQITVVQAIVSIVAAYRFGLDFLAVGCDTFPGLFDVEAEVFQEEHSPGLAGIDLPLDLRTDTLGQKAHLRR